MLSGVIVAYHNRNELSMNAIELGWVNYAFNLALVICTLLSGVCRHTRKKEIVYNWASLFAVSTLLSTLSNSSLMFILLRVVQGTSRPWSGAPRQHCWCSLSHNERGKVLGWNVAAVYLGSLDWADYWRAIKLKISAGEVFFYLGFILQLPVLALLFTKVRGEWAEA